MEGCSLFALLACFSWTNLYIDGGLQVQDVGPLVERTTLIDSPNVADPILVSDIRSATAANPYGRLSIGYEIEFQSVTWAIEATHVSSLATSDDRGVNAIELRLRWRPFTRRE